MLPTAAFRRCWTLLLLGLLLAPASGTAATVHLTGPVGASLRIDGTEVGLLPLAGPVALGPGVYQVRLDARGFEDFSEVLVVREADKVLFWRLRPMPLRRGNAVKGSLVYAGLGQWYSGADIRGWIYFLGETGGWITAIGAELQRSNYKDEYTNFKAQYDSAIDPDQIAFFQSKATESYQDMVDMEELRDTAILVALGSWALSILDAWLLFPSVDIGPGMVPPAETSALMPHREHGLHAAVSLEF
jgi:hypothetical protein